MEREKTALQHIAEGVIKFEYHSTIPVWLANTSKSEIKGLKIIQIVSQKQGCKRFKPKPVHGLEKIQIISKKYNQSQYNEAYNSNIKSKNPESDILKFVKLSTLQISKVLKSDSLYFIEKWLLLGDSEHYTELVLCFLRAFFSVIQVNCSSPLSTSQEMHSKKQIDRVSIYGKKKFADFIKVTLPEIVRSSSQNTFTAKKPEFKESAKLIVNKDHKDMIKMMPGINNFKSLYQDTFHGRSAQYVTALRKDFYCSTSIKLLPDYNGKFVN